MNEPEEIYLLLPGGEFADAPLLTNIYILCARYGMRLPVVANEGEMPACHVE